jgi:hypothetical protein
LSITFVSQVAVGLLGLLFGLQAARVSRADPSSPAVHRLAWTLAAVGFVLAAASNLLQNAWGAWALAEGPHSAVWAASVRWLPAGNYGRTVLKAVLGLLFCALPLLAGLPRRRALAVSAAVLALTIPLGGVYGWREGPLQAGVHFSVYSAFELAEVLSLFTALYIAVLWGTMDRWLWTATAIYAFRQALNALSLAAMVFRGDPGRWSLSPLFVQVVGIVSYSAMLWCAWRRWELARTHQPVPPMLPESRRPQPSLLH